MTTLITTDGLFEYSDRATLCKSVRYLIDPARDDGTVLFTQTDD